MAHVKVWDDPLTFTVEGTGDFPMDMLRHSMAWPTDHEDVETAYDGTGRRQVSMTARKARYVVPDRWASFGWIVKDAEYFPYLDAVEQDKADQKYNAQMLDGCEDEDELNAEMRFQTQ